jgi:hypothetical protein
VPAFAVVPLLVLKVLLPLALQRPQRLRRPGSLWSRWSLWRNRPKPRKHGKDWPEGDSPNVRGEGGHDALNRARRVYSDVHLELLALHPTGPNRDGLAVRLELGLELLARVGGRGGTIVRRCLFIGDIFIVKGGALDAAGLFCDRLAVRL